jgi:hypothetical protein
VVIAAVVAAGEAGSLANMDRWVASHISCLSVLPQM